MAVIMVDEQLWQVYGEINEDDWDAMMEYMMSECEDPSEEEPF